MDAPFNVLSLEDSDLDFEIIREQLIKAGYKLNLSRAETENEFTSLICNNKYDIILADYNLPQFDAFEALRICNIHCPEVPVICVSGSIGEIMAIELLKKGAVDYVLKDRLERLPFAVKRAMEEAKEKAARRQMEESLRLSEEKYRTIFENVQDVFYQTDLNGIIKEISPSIKYFADFNSVELIGTHIVELYHNPDDRKKLLQLLSKKGEVRDYEIRLKTKSSEVKYASINARLVYNSEGVPDHIDGALRDISERKLAENSLKQSEERLRDIMFSTMDWIWEVDEKGRYTYSSQRGVDFFDVAPDEIIGKTPFDFMDPDEAERVTAILAELASKKMPIKDFENWSIGRDGKKICLLTNGVPILDNDGQLLGYRGVDKDITDWKQAEQELITAKEKAEASDRLKTAFMNNISHELRTPLNGILGFAELISEPGMPAGEKQHFLNIMRKSSTRLINTVTDFMDISLITSGNMALNKKVVLLNDLIRSVAEDYEARCVEKGLNFQVDFDNTQQILIETDAELLVKVFHHLLDNAVKFTREGSILLSCAPFENSIKFIVSDTGIGIDDEMQEVVFERFTQETTSLSSGYEGSGLGLSISKGIIQLLGGNIVLESEKGVGTKTSFSLPALPIQFNDKKITDEGPKSAGESVVMIVEDDYFNLLYIETLLRNTGIKTLAARNGQDALEKCRLNEKIELVLMDLKMPVMDGYQATRLIRKLRPDLKIIAITAHAMSGDEHLAFQAGCSDYLTKPFESQVFYSKISKYITLKTDSTKF